MLLKHPMYIVIYLIHFQFLTSYFACYKHRLNTKKNHISSKRYTFLNIERLSTKTVTLVQDFCAHTSHTLSAYTHILFLHDRDKLPVDLLRKIS